MKIGACSCPLNPGESVGLASINAEDQETVRMRQTAAATVSSSPWELAIRAAFKRRADRVPGSTSRRAPQARLKGFPSPAGG